MSTSRPLGDLVVSMGVKVHNDDEPISSVCLRPLHWRSDHEDALRSTIKHHWTTKGGKKGKVVIQSSSYSPAQLKQAVMTVVTGVPAPLEPEEPEVVKTIRAHLHDARRHEALESHRLLTLASLMHGGRHDASWHKSMTYGFDSVMKFNTRNYSWFLEGINIQDTIQKLKIADVSRTSVLSASHEFRRHWLFKDPGAWWLHL